MKHIRIGDLIEKNERLKKKYYNRIEKINKTYELGCEEISVPCGLLIPADECYSCLINYAKEQNKRCMFYTFIK